MYEKETFMDQPMWNNAFSYKERISLWSEGKLCIPSLIQGTVADLQQGSEICFEEAEFTESRFNGMVDWKIISCTGLKNFLQTTYHEVPVYIVDNHNHALSFRYTDKKSNVQRSTCNVIHIDQHSDIKENEHVFSEGNIEDFVNEKTNVGNFITAAINSWIVNTVIQIRTDYALENIQRVHGVLRGETWNIEPFILDIDIDFRAEKEASEADFEIIRKLMKQAELITIATSPYFIDQARAIEIIKKLLSK